MPYNKIVAMNIKRYREERGWDQQTMADKIGISNSLLSHYETGKRKVPVDLVPKFADLFGVPVQQLFGRD